LRSARHSVGVQVSQERRRSGGEKSRMFLRGVVGARQVSPLAAQVEIVGAALGQFIYLVYMLPGSRGSRASPDSEEEAVPLVVALTTALGRLAEMPPIIIRHQLTFVEILIEFFCSFSRL
jgi:hypothetical protein